MDCPMISWRMSSPPFKNEEQKRRKLNYPGNFPLTSEDVDTDPNNGKSGYIKADQWYYFSKDKISYMVIGNMKSDIFNLLIDYIEESDFEIVDIVDNL